MDREKLYRLLRLGIEKGASDIHFQVGYLPLYRFNGDLVELRYKILTEKDTESIARILAESDDKKFDDFNELDLAFELPSEGRFRVNISRQRRFCNIVLRVIPLQIRTFEELNLPSSLRDVARLQRGYVLVTGATGMGKSTTLATLVEEINKSRKAKIVTIEDPIEFVFTHDKSIITQREIGTDTASFPDALRAALRQDPDVIMIGELRDLETIQLAITAAETGHLVFGTLHTSDTISTIDRLIGVFQAEEQAQVRTMLSESLRAVVSQRLVPRADGEGRVPALEILINNGAVGNLIRADKTFQLASVLQTGGAQGMVLLDDSLAQLVKQGTVARDVAVRLAAEPSKFPA